MKQVRFCFRLICVFAAGQALASTTWPNEPAGSAVLSDFGFDSKTGGGWSPVYPQGGAIVTDNTAPLSAPNVLQYTWHHDAGYGDVSNEVFGLPSNTKELYIGLKWKPSNPFNGWSIEGQKILLLDGTYNHCYLQMRRIGAYPGQNYSFWVTHCGGGADNTHIATHEGTGFYANVWSPTVALGQWHTIEWYAKASTTPTSRDGILRMWYDGQLVLNFTSVNNQHAYFRQFQIHPVWDNYEPKCPTCVDHHWFDHVRLSVPNGAIPPFVISTGSLPGAQSGKPYTAYLKAEGGKSPYSWTISSGSLLPGLTLNKSTGVISGTPTTGGKCDFTIRVLDSNAPSKEATKAFTIVASGTSTIKSGNPLTVNSSRLTAEQRVDRVLFRVSQAGAYKVSLYDLSGRELWRHTGTGDAVWNHGGNLKKSVYLVRAEQNGKLMKANYFHVW